MTYLLCYLLLSSPIELPFVESFRFLRPTLRKVCIDYQVIGPKEEHHYSKFRHEVGDMRWRFRELRAAPAIEQAILLPDRDECEYVARFWKGRIDNLEAARKLHGTYRYVDFADAIDHAKDEMYRWKKRAKAANVEANYLDRRLALQWLRDE